MLLSNALRIVANNARRAPTNAAFFAATSKVSQRGFAFAAVQQIQNHTQQRYSRKDANAASSHMGGILAAAAAAAGASAIALNNDRADCCGIAGVVGANGDAREFLLEGLTILKNRGYDSAGIATMSVNPSEGLSITKYASVGENADGLELVREHSISSKGHHIGIAHTRWATHGGKTDENAHPHLDSSGKIALVHNGTLNNANELRRELQSRGHKFTSQTDTEVIAKLIGEYYINEKCSVKDATEKAMARCDGTWGLGIMCTDAPDELIVACNGSPLVIGIGSDRMFIASETSAFNRYTKNFISMKDGEIGVLHADGTTLDLGRMQVAPDQEVKLSPAPYTHWTLKECYEQPEAIGRALGFGGRLTADRITLGGLEKMSDKLATVNFLTLCACGTSLNASRYAEKLMKHLGSFDVVHSVDAAEVEPSDFPHDPKSAAESAFLVVSQSGETKDVARVVNAAQEKDVTVLSVVNAVGSLIARMTKLGVYCNAGRENAVASTKAFTTQVTVLALIALWFRELKDRVYGTHIATAEAANLRESLMRLPICFGMALKTRDKCKKIAERLNGKDHCFVLGKGYGEPVAMEGALKIKEMCYLHAEGYSGGALKHGPFALIESDENGKQGATPIIMLIFDDDHAHHMRTAAEEVKARGADVIIITDKKSLAEGLDDDPLVIPSNGPLTALGAVLPIQLLAFELAMLRNINPDTPRNLAKAVTVD
mmetsp:Transcript_7120/g.14284  ORF Transcript_7120/g.14284 Transcript_7120/m.14284 type:complete len:717 (+) Transcript_7120:170-2320(+)